MHVEDVDMDRITDMRQASQSVKYFEKRMV